MSMRLEKKVRDQESLEKKGKCGTGKAAFKDHDHL